MKTGFVYGRTENAPLIIDVVVEDNIIKVYYYKSNMHYEKTSKAYDGKTNVEIPNTQELIHEGDIIKYTITATNMGKGNEKSIVIKDNFILDWFEYISSDCRRQRRNY